MRDKGVVPFAVAIGILSLGFVGTGLFYLHAQSTGERTTSKVIHCTTGRGRYGCTARWVQGGSLVFGKGRVVSGTLEGAGPSDVGKTLDVRVSGGRAYTPSLRIPIALLAIGAAFLLYGGFEIRKQLVRAA
jgi:hypothetical protein